MRNADRRRLPVALAFGCLLALAGPGQALDPNKTISQYGHDVWQTEQGLPQNTVQAIVQTRDGYLWLGTQEGLVRFDGVRFTLFDKRNTPALRHSVYALCEDREGNLWIGTVGGGLVWLKDGAFTVYGKEQGLSNEQVLALSADREGDLWIGTLGGGLNRLTHGTLGSLTRKEGLSSDQVTSIHEGRDGSLWIGTNGGGLNRLYQGKLTTLTSKEGLSSDHVWAIHEDREGSLWVGTNGGGLDRLKAGKVTVTTTRLGLSGNTVRSLLEDRQGDLWVGTDGGLDRMRNGELVPRSSKDWLSGDAVLAMHEDREGSLWIGTHDSGLTRLKDERFTTYTTREGLPDDQVRAVRATRGGSVWIGTAGGLNRLKDGVLTALTKKDGLSSDNVRTLCEGRDGSLWIGTFGGGLTRLKGGRLTAVGPKQGLSSDNVWSLAAGGDGTIWIGTAGGGLNRLKDGRITCYSTKDGLTNDLVSALHVDGDGTVWIGTNGGGVNRLKGGELTPFTAKQGLTNDVVLSFYEGADGALWIGTFGGGLNRLKDGKLRSVTTREGLFDDVVFQILPDGAGNLWMSCNKGISRASESELNAVADGARGSVTSVAYGTADGMRSAECNSGSGARSQDGLLWFPTVRGVVAVDPSRLPINVLPPPVAIEEVTVDGKAAGGAPGSALVLPPGTRRLEIRYTASSLRTPQKVRFRYRLVGFDPDWMEAGGERSVRFTNLPPKTYTFRVKACNEDGVWNESGASLSFTLRPRFWQTGWFYGLVVAGLVGSGFGVQRTRVARLKAQRQELQHLVELRTKGLAQEKERAEAARSEAERRREEAQALSQRLEEAQQKISRLLESSPGASQSLSDWSRSVGTEIAGAIGAERIGVWEVEKDALSPLSDCGMKLPTPEELHRLGSSPGFVDTGGRTLVPVTGTTGDLCGALAVTGRVAWGETEKRLVAGFAHQLGSTLSMSRLRRQLAAAEERRAATRREMHERGIPTLQVCSLCGRCYENRASACSVDGAPLESPRLLPYRLLDRYRFVQELGEGGMGMILSAYDEKLEREVAIKLIRPEHFGNSDMKLRFEREARTVARIQHPGVIALYDSGELPDGSGYLVMERLTGCDLAALLEKQGPGTPAQVADLIRQGSAALGAAHRAGVVHRDVKPENLFVLDDPSGFRVKVLDFGLAKSAVYEKGLTQSGVIVGTPSYMSPEQVKGEAVDARSDLYSFAAVCYEALTGRRAIPGEDLGRIMLNVLTFEPAPVSSLCPGMPSQADLAFQKALAKDAGNRPGEIELWASRLVEILERIPPPEGVTGWRVSPEHVVPARGT